MSFFKSFFVDIFTLYGINVYTITENGDCIGFLNDLREIVGNKDDGVAALSDTLHMFVQFFTPLLGKRCRCLINNNDLWIK